MMSWVPVVNTMNTRFRGGFFGRSEIHRCADVSDNRHFLANAFPHATTFVTGIGWGPLS